MSEGEVHTEQTEGRNLKAVVGICSDVYMYESWSSMPVWRTLMIWNLNFFECQPDLPVTKLGILNEGLTDLHVVNLKTPVKG